MFSLYPTKNMTSGEGGMVSTGDEELARRLRLYRNQGMERRYENEVVGFNARMTDIHAAIGRVQLGKLPGWTKQRQQNAQTLDAGLAGLPGITVPPVAPGATHVYHQYTIRVADDRDGFAKALLDEHGVGSGVYYPIPNHRLPSFRLELDLPQTELAAQQALSLPVHPALSQAEVERVVEAVTALARAGA
jgi:dTDP-4-amino-4,6-dideoxygalactose transaminase